MGIMMSSVSGAILMLSVGISVFGNYGHLMSSVSMDIYITSRD